ncbi:TetR/AcrR family transcriptional regulator [Tsukamurella tyrosinosolvens]|jgi:AcrR family transcriptional regulator|uniref:DNA-binding transcriptional regulator, AcrR family n=1 Tax=Tsukamurella tyrosinosolvens TaxID=57704 RepID=A0A1H4YPZ9_TSUTY|nr:TetR/AcrR family transcriptional regulator [Tsukamurella tyrosinosolvens]AUN41490.1 TetR family transcriptional regulator [Tsukamurella tyrosinosolvens]KXP00402.1 TetR family transcriptional regulator [Tsukamurella tyrosinosolvens]KXP04823.1 TetR family transcriptional regulator [Tsukamurella tyrosinosolvens]KZL98077.1 TetR family transcriptional regulator [Tsukamurella tyrosinosolvens]MCA4995265.1 TetR/AcrR family transcriptional regulator [Tsukamurella tyrosinosolvens]
MTGPLLPLAQPQTEPRRDAARNRELLIDAAQRLFAEHGVDAVSMDAVAQAAGVGKGTVFRRFGSRAGLLQALLDHDETELQQRFMFGPPPLGPGGDPVHRLTEYGKARMQLIARHGDLLRGAEQAARDPYDEPPWRVSAMTVRSMLVDAGRTANTEVWAAALMATLSPGWVLHQLASGVSQDELEAVWAEHVRLLAAL